MITQKQFEECLALDHEITGVEFKGPCSRSDGYMRAKIARAVMGMTNRRDGGIIIIGVEDRDGNLNPVGLSESDAASWKNIDRVIDALDSYIHPPAIFDASIFEFEGKKFAVLEVQEFADFPTICKKQYRHPHQSGRAENVLKEGACYVRSRHKPETVEISSLEQMHELLELAIEKGVRKFVTQAQKAGLSLSRGNQDSDQDLFEQQVITAWTSSTLEKIQSRGYWRVIIRPDTFSREIFSYNDLFPLVQRLAVGLHGDDFPNVLPERSRMRGVDFIGQEIEARQFLEAWKLYQSGQFLHYSGMVDDWLDQGGWLQLPEGWQPGKQLAIEEVVRQFTGIFVFAARLALTDAYLQDDYVRINVFIKGLQGRKLYISSPRKVPLRWNYQADIPEYPYEKRLQKEELIANAANLALQAAKEFFIRLGWDASLASLEGTQANYYKGS